MTVRTMTTGAPRDSLFSRTFSTISRHPITRQSVAAAFRGLQSVGVSVVPNHFYFPVPDLRTIPQTHWGRPRTDVGFDFRFDDQIRNLAGWTRYNNEWNFDEAKESYEFHLNNGFFETVDAEVAYSIVRERKPRRIIEIGSGNTTRLIATALRRNEAEGHAAGLYSIEPHPDPILRNGFPGFTELHTKPVQQVPLEFFDTLDSGDILFIDSSHVTAIGSDVVYEILSILPRLKKGVIIHLHDIFMPCDYPEKFVRQNLCFWNEQYMLEAFLSFNNSFRVIWASSAMQSAHKDVLVQNFPRWDGSYKRMPKACALFAPTLDGNNVWPCSFWMERYA